MQITILTQYYPPEFGAASIYWGKLAQLLADDGHQITVLTSVPNYPTGIIPNDYRGKWFFREHDGAVNIIRVSVFATPKKNPRTRLLNQISFMCMAAIRGTFSRRADVLIVESHPLFVCLTAGWLKRIKGMPIVLNVSDLWPESAVATGALRPDSLIVKIAEHVERWAYSDATHIIAMTRGVQDGINKVHQRPERVTMLYNSVDLDRFRSVTEAARAAIRKRFGLEGQFVAAHVGNMSLTYDLNLILNVAAELPEITFVFAGGGSQQDYLSERIATLKLANVRMLGLLPYEEMPAFWAVTDICLIALGDHSVAGGTMPAKLFEAMATGTPIVAAIRGEGEGVLREAGAGIPTPIGDVQMMTDAVRSLYRNPQQLQKISAAGQTYAKQHFSMQHSKRAFLDVIENVLLG